MNYTVKVNGRVYEVEIERRAAGAAPSFPAQAPAPRSVASPIPAPIETHAAPVVHFAESDTKIMSPLPGNIFNILVNPGDSVAAGQVLIVIESMKMENEVISPRAGTVKQVLVSKGSVVESDDVLIVLS